MKWIRYDNTDINCPHNRSCFSPSGIRELKKQNKKENNQQTLHVACDRLLFLTCFHSLLRGTANRTQSGGSFQGDD